MKTVGRQARRQGGGDRGCHPTSTAVKCKCAGLESKASMAATRCANLANKITTGVSGPAQLEGQQQEGKRVLPSFGRAAAAAGAAVALLVRRILATSYSS